MRYDLALVAGFLQPRSRRFGAVTVFLRADTYAVKLPGIGRQLAQEGGKTLLAKIGREAFGVFLVAEAPQLHRPHACR